MTCLWAMFLVLCFVDNSSAIAATWSSCDNGYHITSLMEQKIWAVLVTNTYSLGNETASVRKEKLYLDGCTWNHV